MLSLRNAIRLHAEDARQFVYRVLTFHILNMVLLPDAKLGEGETSAQLGVSRTPVHDTFAQLERERMLVVEARRGTFVSRLDAENIRQIVWINRTTIIGVLESLYTLNLSKSKLESLQKLVADEMAALKMGDFALVAKLDTKFYREMFGLAGLAELYRALQSNSVDLYRLTRMDYQADYWAFIVAQHAALAHALLKHNHNDACAAVIKQYEAVEPLLNEMQRKNPQYFKES